jgi:hypothetical protein
MRLHGQWIWQDDVRTDPALALAFIEDRHVTFQEEYPATVPRANDISPSIRPVARKRDHAG